MAILILIVLAVVAAFGGLFLYDRLVQCSKCKKYVLSTVNNCSPNNFNRRPAMIVTASSSLDKDGNPVQEAVPYDLTCRRRFYTCKSCNPHNSQAMHE